jgi:agmatinase
MVDVSTGVWLRRANESLIVDVGDVDVFPNNLVRSSESMRTSARAIATAGATPILLGGDHYMTYPLFHGWAEGMGARGKRTFGYIQYDNHLDFSDDNRIWGKLWHGSQARRISELPFVRPRNMVWIGPAGSHSKEQADWITATGATLFHPGHVREQGIAEVTRRAIQLASESTDGIYVSVDIDVVLGAASPGTGAIVVDGISPSELLTSIRLVAESGLVSALDVAEVAPPLDPTDRTTRLAAEVVLEFASPVLFDREDFVLVAPA